MPAAAGDATPLNDEETAGLFAPLKPFGRLALAVSGGGDSMALLHLYDRWRHADHNAPPAIVLSVDHGLRAEAADEAALVARSCERAGIPHTTLRWQGPKPSSGLQEAARAARYALMLEAMQRAGAKALVLAHTRDDQAETFLDRLARGSGVYGLAAMAPVSRRAGVAVLRPLLDIPRARLRTTLQAAGVGWAEDPSNADPHYRRVRMRQLLPVLAKEGLGADRLAATARSMARAAAALDGWVDTLIETDVACHPAGPSRFEAALLDRLPEEVALRLLARLLRDTAGAGYGPRLAPLEASLAALRAGEGRRTLSGCVLERRADSVVLHRELGRSGLPALAIAPGETGIWDGRFAVSLSAEASGPVEVAALGPGGLARAGLNAPKGWPRRAFAGSPVARTGEHVLALPGFETPQPAGRQGWFSARRIDALA